MKRTSLALLPLGLLLGCTPLMRAPGPTRFVGRPPRSPVEALVAESLVAEPPGAPARASRAGEAATARIVATAESLLGAKRLVVGGETFRYDCSGFVEATLHAAGGGWRGSTAMLFDAARQEGVLHRRRRPSPGDVAFFDDTYDRDGDGRINDALTHSAVVDSVDEAGTITLIHLGGSGVTRLRMNLLHPEDRSDAGGAVINDYLRARSSKDGPRTRTLTGELWVGFGSFWRNIPVVVDGRQASRETQ